MTRIKLPQSPQKTQSENTPSVFSVGSVVVTFFMAQEVITIF